MLVTLQAGPYTVRGISVGGVYTALQVPELGACFDVGIAPRSFASTRNLFLSHAHVDHIGALASMLGIRGLMRLQRRLTLFLPAEVEESVVDILAAQSKLQRYDLSVDAVGMRPGDEYQLRSDLIVRAIRTFHPVPSLGFQFLRRVNKLRSEHAGLSGAEIGARRKAGEELFDRVELIELAYVTDSLARVLDANPSLYQSRVLILECTFLDQRKSLEATRAGCHIHLDELVERADSFANEQLVLMHVSQIYRPSEIRSILADRLPPELMARVQVLAPSGDVWPG